MGGLVALSLYVRWDCIDDDESVSMCFRSVRAEAGGELLIGMSSHTAP